MKLIEAYIDILPMILTSYIANVTNNGNIVAACIIINLYLLWQFLAKTNKHNREWKKKFGDKNG